MSQKNYGNNYGKGKGRFNSKGKTSYSKKMTSFAYQMGCVQRGLKNPDSAISASFKAGENHVARQKKSLY
jgi:hypothetical protein